MPDASQFMLDLEIDQAWERLKQDPGFAAALGNDVFQRMGLEAEIQRIKEGGLPGGGVIPTLGQQLPGMGGSNRLGVPGLSNARQPEPPEVQRMRKMQEAAIGQR